MQARAISISLFVAFLVLVGKVTASWITGSTALFADAAESVVHVVVTGFSAFCIWFAARPADETHPYGHGRIVYFGVGFEGALVTGTAVYVFVIGIRALLEGRPLLAPSAGLAIGGGVMLCNIVLATWLGRCARTEKSSVLAANATHIWSDVLTSAAALSGVGLAWLTGKTWCDAVAALAVALLILHAGFVLLRRAVAGLMDRVRPEDLEPALQCLTEAVRENRISGFHQVKARFLDDQFWLDVHVLVPDELTIKDAHERATEVEARIDKAYDRLKVQVTTHIEPEGHDESHPPGHETPTDPIHHHDTNRT